MTQDNYTDNRDNAGSFTSQDNENGLAIEETSETISSRKVEGTAVYGTDTKRLGTIASFMVNKVSGQVEYAVLEFGGLFGIGSDHYPIPWSQLRYSTEQSGYAAIPQLRGAWLPIRATRSGAAPKLPPSNDFTKRLSLAPAFSFPAPAKLIIAV